MLKNRKCGSILLIIGILAFILIGVHISKLTLLWNGISKSESGVFPTTILPHNAVQFEEADTQSELLLQSYILVIPVALLCIATLIYKRNKAGFQVKKLGLLLGAVCGLIATVPHEFIHAICFPAGSKVEIGLIVESFSAYASSAEPMTKWQFVFMSIMPFIVLGIIPFIAFLIISKHNYFFGTFLWAFAIFGLIGGTPDILNVFNIQKQMPAGAILQMSGFHSYWYFP